MANYTITGSGSTSSAVENGGAGRTTSGATVTVINTVIGWMSANQTAEFLGSFTLGSALATIYKTGITLDFGTTVRAIVVCSGSFTFDVRGSNNTIRGGDISGGNEIIVAGYGGSSVTLDSVKLHGASDEACQLNNNGNNTIINCEIYNAPQTLFIAATAVNNLISGCNFHGFGASASRHGIYIYSDNNEIVNNKFHDPASGGAACLLKHGGNKIHGNEFWNMPNNGAPPISMYCQNTGVNNNEIYNNNFHDCYEAMIIGNSVDVASSTHTLIHDNIFQNLTVGIYLPFDYSGSSSYVDIEIYYNQFLSCATPIRSSSGNASIVVNCQIAYNTFNPSTSSPAIESFTNTKVYGNTGLADYNGAGGTIPPPNATTPTVSISATTSTNIRVGQSVSFTANVIGGTSPYTVTWYPIGGTGNPKTISFPDVGTFNVHAIATDSASQTSPQSNTVQVIVTAVPIPAITINASTSTNIVAGQSVTFTASVSGGTPPYTVNWYDDAGNPKGTGTPRTITFASQGTYYIHAVAVDSASQTSPNSNTIQVTVTAIPIPSVTIQATTPTSIYAGQSVSFTATVTSGTPPYVISWNPSGTGSSTTIVFPNTGVYSVYAVATDSASQTSPLSNQIQVTVSAPPNPQLSVTVTPNPATIQTDGASNITVHVTALGTLLQGASVTLTASGGNLAQNSGITNSAGNFVTNFTDINVEIVTIAAAASATGYTTGQGTATITVTAQPTLVTITGIVKNPDGAPIAGANVSIGTANTTSQANGSYTFQNVEAKAYQMTVTALGYEPWAFPLDASAGGTVTQNVVLTASIAPLPMVEIAVGGSVAVIALYLLFK